MSEYTLDGLVKYVTDIYTNYPTLYAWGGIMRKCSPSYITTLKNQYPGKYTYQRVNYLTSNNDKVWLCDCAGLIKSYYWGGIGSPNYSPSSDYNTNMMLSMARKSGKISTLPEEPGIILYMPGHVGVYVGKNCAIECTLGVYGDGVVKTNVLTRGWTNWLKLSEIDDSSIDYDNGYRLHFVKPGESWWSIAEKEMGSGTKYMTLCMFNEASPSTVIHPGDILKIPE